MLFSYEELEKKAKLIRKEAFEMVLSAGCGHLGGSFSCLEMLVALYYGGILRFNAKNPEWPERDRFIMSKGHANNALYVILADIGFFERDKLKDFCKNASMLGNHCDVIVPGIEVSSGALGHGLGIACGIALGAQISGEDFKVYAMLGDGECQEGSVWEAMMFANHHKLNNLMALVDRNMLGSEDFTENTVALNPLKAKWESFGWDVFEIDGHSFEEIIKVLDAFRNKKNDKPVVVIANTFKGKGISFLENTPKSHHTLPEGENIFKAREELR